MAFADDLTAFAASAAAKLKSGLGEPEDQIRGPFEELLKAVGPPMAGGHPVTPVGETSLSEERIRPDYAVLVGTSPVPIGFTELKAPGVGADTSKFKGRNKEQWRRLSALPNVLYTDGNDWALYREGELARCVVLDGDVQAGKLLDPDGELEALLADYLAWEPIPPRNTTQLVNSVAGLTRLLRDEVLELTGSGGALDALAADWRTLLFPDATDAAFADGYAQSVTFGLLLARAEGIDFNHKGLPEIARELGKGHSLLGKALGVLTEEDLIGKLFTSVMTLVRVTGAVDWSKITDRGREPWLRFYEDFLGAYDNELRKASGSYYTPTEVVGAMVRLTDELLRTRLGIADGFASSEVTTVDPAMGTGTYLLEVIRRVAADVEEREGPGAVGPQLRLLANRLIGFEIQMGPYAVSELRTLAEIQARGGEIPLDGLRLYVTDTLADPYIEAARLPATFEPIARSRREANRVKASEPVTVVIGNPPYKDKAGGMGGWIEQGDPAGGKEPPLDAFRSPGNGRLEYVLSNLYVYFWRWALWKALEFTGENDRGVVAYITSAGWLNGPGFKGMRRRLREVADDVFVIDCTPEGHQPEVATRLFPGVQQPIAIVLAVRNQNGDRSKPATVWRTAVTGRRQDKFEQLAALTLNRSDWVECATDWEAPLAVVSSATWDALPALADLFPWTTPGVKPNRTFVYAPTEEVLRQRWSAFVEAPPEEKPKLLKETRDRQVSRLVEPFPGVEPHAGSLGEAAAPCPALVRIGFRWLHRMWCLPDSRMMDTGRPELWAVRNPHQLFFFELHRLAATTGPALTFSAEIPDNHYFRGSFAGRALPLWRDAAATEPNVAPGLLAVLSERLGIEVSAEDLAAYTAGVVAHSGFTARYLDDLAVPGVRVPLSADPATWNEAVELGRQVVWVATYGERMGEGKPQLPAHRRPKVLLAVPDNEEGMPADVAYEPETQTLSVGHGRIAPVPPEVWAYEVSTYKVVQRWLKRRLREPEGKRSSPLDDIVATTWTPAMSTELLELLNVVGLLIDLEAEQASLLERVLDGDLIDVAALTTAGVLPVPESARKAFKIDSDTLFEA